MKLRESETLELKKSTSELKEAVVSIAAMLNKHGEGTLWFGVKNDGEVIGQTIGQATLRTVSQAITSHIEPEIYPTIEEKTIQGKTCISVKVQGQQAPYFAYGRVYMRVADEDRQMSVAALERLINAKNRFSSPWESEVSKLLLSDASVKAARSFVKKANESGRINYRFDSTRNVLGKLGLTEGRKLLNAGKVLFSSNHIMEVQAAVFAGTDKVTFLDIQSFRGNLFDLMQKSEQYIKEHINWRAEIKSFKREEIPEIPVTAFREAILNSLCHRDFSNPKSNEVAIFKDRIEIYNPGSFPEGHTPEEFIKGRGHSLLRNPLIANTFYLASDIERWGSGLRRIHEACKNAGVTVDFQSIKTGFLVTFQRSEKTREKLREKTRERILRIIQEHPEITTAALSAAIAVSPKAIEWHLKKLKLAGVIRRVGADKGGHWLVVSS